LAGRGIPVSYLIAHTVTVLIVSRHAFSVLILMVLSSKQMRQNGLIFYVPCGSRRSLLAITRLWNQ
jgi:hypothetical protein